MITRNRKAKAPGASIGPRATASTGRGARPSLVDACFRLIRYLEKRNDILLLATSTRYRKEAFDVPKTTQLALRVRDHLRRRKKSASPWSTSQS